jgi:hydratase-aldolase
MVLAREETRGVWSLIPACATPDGDSVEARDTVDCDKLAAMVERLIKAGVNGIATTGTLGEGHTLLWDEHKKLISTVVETARKRVPVFTGTTSLGTRRTIEKTRWAIDAGSDGVLNGVPMWLQPSWQNAVQFYKDVAEAVPNAAVMVYHNPPVFRVTIPPAGFKQLAQVPNIIAVKQTVTEMRHWLGVRDAVEGRINILVSDNVVWPTAMFGAAGVWSTRSSGAPEPPLRLWEACSRGDWARAEEIQRDINDSWPAVTTEEFHIYDTPLMKRIIDLVSDGQAGPTRRPFVHLPANVEKAAQDAAVKWKALAAKYREPLYASV